jgi:hypothetical protein
MQQVADWLKQLGMPEYVQRFVDNDIDFSVLRHLNDQDLKELGVSLGHGRKMLASIAELVSAVPTSPAAPATEPKAEDSAERRQVTVLICDLVGRPGSSALFRAWRATSWRGPTRKLLAAQITRQHQVGVELGVDPTTYAG